MKIYNKSRNTYILRDGILKPDSYWETDDKMVCNLRGISIVDNITINNGSKGDTVTDNFKDSPEIDGDDKQPSGKKPATKTTNKTTTR